MYVVVQLWALADIIVSYDFRVSSRFRIICPMRRVGIDVLPQGTGGVSM